MADVIAECKERTYDFSWLPATLGDFKLVIDTTADGLYYRFFHYAFPLLITNFENMLNIKCTKNIQIIIIMIYVCMIK